MTDALEIWRKPQADEMYMIAGWRQWADAGSVSSGLPQYLIQQTGAKKIGQIRPDGFYIFQVPGTHDLMRPMVKFNEGYPELLQTQQNELYYFGDMHRGVVIFLGDEPHLDIERYIASILDAAKTLNVRRIIGLGGVYGELPFDKERVISCNYSMPELKSEAGELAVNLSDYQGGASIGSYLCRRAGDHHVEYIGLYAFVPAYDFSMVSQIGNTIRIENDYMAWMGIMRRINYMTKLGLDLTHLQQKSKRLLELVESKIEELDNSSPQLGVREYIRRLSEEFQEVSFSPLDDVWEENLRRLLNKLDDEGNDEENPPAG
jgi:proteasome assembly chaperone (PAC2) family protein